MNELWEYKVEAVEVGRYYYDAMLELHLRPLGDQGWELVHITERKNFGSDDVHLKAYFKRRISKVGCSTSTNPADFIWQSEAPPDDDKRTQALRIIQTWAACDSESSETREEAMAAIVDKCRSALS